MFPRVKNRLKMKSKFKKQKENSYSEQWIKMLRSCKTASYALKLSNHFQPICLCAFTKNHLPAQ